jgi:predicted transcriptional regulator
LYKEFGHRENVVMRSGIEIMGKNRLPIGARFVYLNKKYDPLLTPRENLQKMSELRQKTLEGIMDKKALLELTTDIVSAHASVNEMGKEELLEELQSVFQKLMSLAGTEGGEGAEISGELKPAVPVNKAFGADKVLCLVCGKGFTTLKKHIAVSHQMTPKEYRKAFGVPSKTPLVARKYSDSKRKIAQDKGLAKKLAEGRKRKAGK